jgi:hypothetical protein
MAARVALATLCALALPWSAQAQVDVGAFDIVDLTHALGADTVFWPATPPERFELTQLAFGDTEDGGFYAANRFCSAAQTDSDGSPIPSRRSTHPTAVARPFSRIHSVFEITAPRSSANH